MDLYFKLHFFILWNSLYFYEEMRLNKVKNGLNFQLQAKMHKSYENLINFFSQQTSWMSEISTALLAVQDTITYLSVLAWHVCETYSISPHFSGLYN